MCVWLFFLIWESALVNGDYCDANPGGQLRSAGGAIAEQTAPGPRMVRSESQAPASWRKWGIIRPVTCQVVVVVVAVQSILRQYDYCWSDMGGSGVGVYHGKGKRIEVVPGLRACPRRGTTAPRHLPSSNNNEAPLPNHPGCCRKVFASPNGLSG